MNLVILTYRKLRTEQNEKFSSHFVSVTCPKKTWENFQLSNAKAESYKNEKLYYLEVQKIFVQSRNLISKIMFIFFLFILEQNVFIVNKFLINVSTNTFSNTNLL